MTTPMYLGAALCYNPANVALYENACLSVNEIGNSWQIHGAEFDCTGILMSKFYDALVAGGETDACVCLFQNTGSWTFQQYWGPCENACTQPYTCNASRPVLADNSSPTTTSAVSSSTTSSPVSGGGSGSSSVPAGSTSSAGPVSVAVPLVIGWKILLGIMTFSMFDTIT